MISYLKKCDNIAELWQRMILLTQLGKLLSFLEDIKIDLIIYLGQYDLHFVVQCLSLTCTKV